MEEVASWSASITDYQETLLELMNICSLYPPEIRKTCHQNHIVLWPSCQLTKPSDLKEQEDTDVETSLP